MRDLLCAMRSTNLATIGLFLGIFLRHPPSSAQPAAKGPALSAYSIGIARALPRTVTATLLFSKDLPKEFASEEMATRALLRQYQEVNRTRFKISEVDPASAPSGFKSGACAIAPVHFRESLDERRNEALYLGLCLQDGARSLLVPDVFARPGLEFEISRWLTKVAKALPTVGFTVGHGELDSGQRLAKMKQFFDGEFDVVGLDPSAVPIGEKISALVVAGPNQPFNKVGVDAVAGYLDGGKSAIFLLPTMRVNGPAPAKSLDDRITFDLSPVPATGLEPLLARYGFRVEPGITMVESSNAANGRITLADSRDILQLLPHYLRLGGVKQDHPALEDVSTIVLSSASQVTAIPEPKGGATQAATVARVTELLTAPTSSWIRGKPFTIDPGNKGSFEAKPARKARALAFAYEGKTRLLVLGTATFLDDEFFKLGRFDPGYMSGMWIMGNALRWMTEEPALSALRPRAPAPEAKPSEGN